MIFICEGSNRDINKIIYVWVSINKNITVKYVNDNYNKTKYCIKIKN
jgi:hypothetical protein